MTGPIVIPTMTFVTPCKEVHEDPANSSYSSSNSSSAPVTPRSNLSSSMSYCGVTSVSLESAEQRGRQLVAVEEMMSRMVLEGQVFQLKLTDACRSTRRMFTKITTALETPARQSVRKGLVKRPGSPSSGNRVTWSRDIDYADYIIC
eukprot:Sspe_Gene.66936::Locus_39533_Transcript_1_1_Confidence_1.000_Length_714::g.66936::m.66936